jgi:putative transposase
MGWRKTDALSERAKFIFEWERRWKASKGKRVDVSELCRRFDISRQTGYVWIRRYVAAGRDLRALEDRSRRPLSNPRAVTPALEEMIVAARRQRPKWGPRMLRDWLIERHPQREFPSASCIGSILKRRGLSAPPRRQRRGERTDVSPPFPSCDGPNQVWCMDFKGWFRMRDGTKCYPFTLLDAHSRFLLRCIGLSEPNGTSVEHILESAFREYGLPHRIRSDGGPPFFAAQSPASLSRLSIWLLKMGVTLECIAPAKPQQNGRLERFHRTLKLELAIDKSLANQQRALDEFRRIYNFERPHSALGSRPPWTAY